MTSVEHLSALVCKVEAVCNGCDIGSATAFFVEHKQCYYLVSNWHVLSGCNVHTGQPLVSSAIPDMLKISYLNKDLKRINACVKLNDKDSNARWLQHPKRGQEVDIAAVKVIFSDPANTPLPTSCEATEYSVRMRVGDDAFVIGYPLGISSDHDLPIWKRASIASEPGFGVNGNEIILLDTATRKGMSGAPVFLVKREGYTQENGGVAVNGEAFRFLGVYSGRLKENDELSAQLGICWKPHLLIETLEGDCRGKARLS
jgi:Trypsin-like peptidase domain